MLLSYYGDDFTGSTDVMEALTRSGVSTVLFVDPPRPKQLERYPNAQAVGIAGWSRAMTPAEMDRHLPKVFEALRALNPPLIHYKICSTFDSSPQIGSIGHAIDLGDRASQSPFVPLVVGAPVLGRYCVFGNLFARSGLDTEPYRLDRHPTMRQHPVTPMDEADLTVHLSKQTRKPIGLFDVLRLETSAKEAERFLKHLIEQNRIVLFDTLYERHLPTVGRMIWQYARADQPLLVVGSSGVEYALTAHWRQEQRLPEPPAMACAQRTDRLLVVSGSCSSVTDRQITHALAQGFTEVALDTAGLIADQGVALEQAIEKTVRRLKAGGSVIVHTSRGPDDPRIAAAQQAALADGGRGAGRDISRMLGDALGTVLRDVLREVPLSRAAVTGGDTSGRVARVLGIEALEMVGTLAPGSPLCRIHAADRTIDEMEITFKGGQVGRTDFFDVVLNGGPSAV